MFTLLFGEKMLQENIISVKFSCYKDNIKNHQDFRMTVPSPFMEILQKPPNSLHTSM